MDPKLAVYDFRTNQHFTLKLNALRDEHLDDFAERYLFGERPEEASPSACNGDKPLLIRSAFIGHHRPNGGDPAPLRRWRKPAAHGDFVPV